MISKVEINGFRSLVDFKIKLKPGINVLLGPNGVGKTNIIHFFQFLSLCTHNTVSKALEKLGGVIRNFNRRNASNRTQEIIFRIEGQFKIEQNVSCFYEYDCVICYDNQDESLYYKTQHLKFRKLRRSKSKKAISSNRWHIDIEYTFSQNDDFEKAIKLKALDPVGVDSFLFGRAKDLAKDVREGFVKSLLFEYNLSQNSLIGGLLRITRDFDSLYLDLVCGDTYNLIPSKILSDIESSGIASISQDGSGTIATLHEVAKTNEHRVKITVADKSLRLPRVVETIDYRSYDTVLNYIKVANPNITSFKVDRDELDGKFIAKVTMQIGDSNIEFPFSSLSDGTLKWISLVCAISISKSIFSIEEPENYLHPWLQNSAIKIMREIVEESKGSRVMLISTHSESMINCLKPEEVIIISLNRKGFTEAKRLRNLISLKDEISKTGFGLGFYYLSNSLFDE